MLVREKLSTVQQGLSRVFNSRAYRAAVLSADIGLAGLMGAMTITAASMLPLVAIGVVATGLWSHEAVRDLKKLRAMKKSLPPSAGPV